MQLPSCDQLLLSSLPEKMKLDSSSGWLMEKIRLSNCIIVNLLKVHKNGQIDWKWELSKFNLQCETHL